VKNGSNFKRHAGKSWESETTASDDDKKKQDCTMKKNILRGKTFASTLRFR